MGAPGLAQGLTPLDEFIRWRREETGRQAGREGLCDPALWGGEREPGPHTEQAHTCGRARQGQEGKDEMGARASSKCCASWSLNPLICSMGVRKSITSVPIVHVRKQRLDRAGCLCWSRRDARVPCSPRRCLRGGSHKMHLKRRGNLSGSRPQSVPADTPVLLYKNSVS